MHACVYTGVSLCVYTQEMFVKNTDDQEESWCAHVIIIQDSVNADTNQ